MASETKCLGGVCLGDSVKKLNGQSWMPGDQMELHNETDLPYKRVVESFKYAKNSMDGYYRAKNKKDPLFINTYLESEKEFIEKYTVGIKDEERLSLNPYYRSLFFDNKALDILQKVIACKGIKLHGFKQTKHGNVDMVSIMPSPSTGKFEVVSIQRQFTEMDKPQKEVLIDALEKKYPSIMSLGDARRATFRGKWDENISIMFWDDIFGVLILTKVFRKHDIGGYGDNTSLTQAINAYGREHDDILLRNTSCSNKLAPKLDIE
jgi:hypothetical protein